MTMAANQVAGSVSRLDRLSIIVVLNLFFINTAVGQTTILWYHFCNGNFTAGSPYAANLNTLRASVAKLKSNNYGFYNLSVSKYGAERDTSNGIALCRGDIDPTMCLTCIQNASVEIRRLCPESIETGIWYDSCMFRYTNKSIYGLKDTHPTFYMKNSGNVTDKAAFDKTLRDLLENLKSRAVVGGPRKKYASGNLMSSNFATAYAIVQCTPDLSRRDCESCLTGNIAQIPNCCDGKMGGRVINPSCHIRFESGPFTSPESEPGSPPAIPPASAPPSETSSTKDKGSRSTTVIIAVAIPVIASLLLIFLAFTCIYLRRQRKTKAQGVDHQDDEIMNGDSLQMDFGILRTATDDFSEDYKLGEGGFGSVYKGVLENGKKIAVKRLSAGSGQGDAEFKNEVLLVVKLQHRNLVRLRGFCIEGSERLLVYEFFPNGSLDSYIFDPIKQATLDWKKRYKIIGGIARGLLYLHEDSRFPIVHRDLKASNILLDEEMNPKIADFGMARLYDATQTQRATRQIVGTYGYMAPEYACRGLVSFKVDVFSFGVMILEIIIGRRRSSVHSDENADDLLTIAWKKWSEGEILALVDRNLENGSSNEITRCIHIALLCVQDNAANRPSMASVVLMLSSLSITLPMPLQPNFNNYQVGQYHSTLQEHNPLGLEGSNSIEDVKLFTNPNCSITELYA